MTTRQPRFEIVRTDAGHVVRFIASNGREVWRTSESYARQKAALRAIELIVGSPVRTYGDELEVSVPFGVTGYGLLEVRTVDERTKP
jgi:uncharacterized protein YegP (UPF0339 family)